MDTTEQMQQPQLVLPLQQPITPRKPKRGRPKSIDMSAAESTSKTVNKTVNKPINDSNDKLTNELTDKLTNKSTAKSTDRSTNKSTHKSTDKTNSMKTSRAIHKAIARQLVRNQRLKPHFKKMTLKKPVKQQDTVVQFAVPLTYQIVSIAIPKSV